MIFCARNVSIYVDICMGNCCQYEIRPRHYLQFTTIIFILHRFKWEHRDTCSLNHVAYALITQSVLFFFFLYYIFSARFNTETLNRIFDAIKSGKSDLIYAAYSRHMVDKTSQSGKSKRRKSRIFIYSNILKCILCYIWLVSRSNYTFTLLLLNGDVWFVWMNSIIGLQ